jgi:hypothetical protein
MPEHGAPVGSRTSNRKEIIMSRTIRMLTTAQYQALLVGLPKYCATTVFTIAGASYTTPQVVALIQSVMNASLAVAPAKATYLATTKAIAQSETTDGETVKEVREVVALMFKNAPSTLAELAISPRKVPQPLSTAARAVAEAKAKATRLARGTTSKKQKALVTGNVTGVSITPITVPSAVPTATGSTVTTVPSGTAAPAVPAASAGGSSTPHA